MEVEDTCPGIHRGARLGRELVRRPRHRGMVAIAVERGLEKRHVSERIPVCA
jgi:hypothetical protein